MKNTRKRYCSGCNTRISTKAARCHYCGKRTLRLTHFLALIVSAGAALFLLLKIMAML